MAQGKGSPPRAQMGRVSEPCCPTPLACCPRRGKRAQSYRAHPQVQLKAARPRVTKHGSSGLTKSFLMTCTLSSRPGRVAQRVACRPGLKLVLRLQIHAKAKVSQALSDPKAEAGYLEPVPPGAPNHAAPRFPATCLLCSV